MANIPIKNLLTLIQKRFLSTTTTTSQPSSSFTAHFLINNCGISPKSALSISQKLKLDEKDPQRPESVLQFFKSNGMNDTQLAKLVQYRPKILHCKVDHNLKPKVEYFTQNGITGTLLAELIASNPATLFYSLDARLKPSFEFLKKFLGSNDKIMMALKRSSWLLTYDMEKTVKPNADFLIKGGVPISSISKLIVSHPRAMMRKLDMMVYAFNAVKELGLEPKAPMFVVALRFMISLSETTLKKKMEVFKSVGWSEAEILVMLRTYPSCFGLSEEKIRTMMDFYVNTMKLEPKTIIASPKFLLFSMDKRVRPRYNVLKILQSKKFIREKQKITHFLTCSEQKFLENFVNKYKNEVPELLEIYKNTTNLKAEKKVV